MTFFPDIITVSYTHLFQYPAKELERLRKEKTILDDEKSIVEVRIEVNEGFDLLIEDIAVTDRSFQISMGGQMLFKYENCLLYTSGREFESLLGR